MCDNKVRPLYVQQNRIDLERRKEYLQLEMARYVQVGKAMRPDPVH